MMRDELEAIAWKLGVFKTVVATTPHPVDNWDRFCQAWAQVRELGDELTVMACPDAEPPPDE
jgi:hypothetical protein